MADTSRRLLNSTLTQSSIVFCLHAFFAIKLHCMHQNCIFWRSRSAAIVPATHYVQSLNRSSKWAHVKSNSACCIVSTSTSRRTDTRRTVCEVVQLLERGTVHSIHTLKWEGEPIHFGGGGPIHSREDEPIHSGATGDKTAKRIFVCGSYVIDTEIKVSPIK